MSRPVRLTRRGRVVVVLAAALAVLAFTRLSSDVCWVGNGYGSCEELWFGQEASNAR